MKFAVGYQYRTEEELFAEIAADYREHIAEVYFSAPGFASGRPENGVVTEKWEQLAYELSCIRKNGIALDLLLNGNCYGKWAVSIDFQQEIIKLLEYLGKLDLFPEIITTTTPFVAHTIKKHFPNTEIRASVNMRLDSITALSYLANKFDSFYIRRDFQRDLEVVKMFSSWCRNNGKKLCMLANSGCLRDCPYQTFHDNLVAHNAEVRQMQNATDFLPHLCWEQYQHKENWSKFLRSSWIRPESISLYAPYVDVIKLATRQHYQPRMVIAAYTSGHFDGNVFNLTEPCFADRISPYILDNKRLNDCELPAACAAKCNNCGKCDEILEHALVKFQE